MRRPVARAMRATIVLLAMHGPVAHAGAQEAAGAPRRAFRLVIDNDLIAVRGAGVPPDFDYTHGTRLTVAWPAAPGGPGALAGRLEPCTSADRRRRGCAASSLSLGQRIYTPRRDDVLPVPGERPYAGWLYADAAAHQVTERRARTLGVTLGVTGPPSLAEQTQDAIHRLLGNEPQAGWAHQLRATPGLALRFDERRLIDRAGSDGRARSAALRWGVVAGNVRTAAHLGVVARAGWGGAASWSPDEPDVARPTRLHVMAGWQQELVARDLFLDGDDRERGRAVEGRPLVGQLELGLGVRGRGYAVEYRYVRRGREYRAQPGAHAYGSLRVTWSPRRPPRAAAAIGGACARC